MAMSAAFIRAGSSTPSSESAIPIDAPIWTGLAGDVERLGERRDRARGDPLRILGNVDVGEEHRELVAREAGPAAAAPSSREALRP
jgi:hypothetical protein